MDGQVLIPIFVIMIFFTMLREYAGRLLTASPKVETQPLTPAPQTLNPNPSTLTPPPRTVCSPPNLRT